MSAAVEPRRSVVLLSGGLDSATALSMAQAAGYDCRALCIDYGQRHAAELRAAERVARQRKTPLRTLKFDLTQIGGSALTDPAIAVPETATTGIPVTYVPARNTIFLSLALGYAETLGAAAIHIGVNAVDYSGYPDCRPQYIEAFRTLAGLATRAGVEGKPIRIETPLLSLSKADIIRRGTQLGVDFSLTVSCYQADDDGRACGRCDACRLRREGFAAAGVADPTRYR
jgi:7-cyano-7-deazaguanine synthase